MHKPMPLELEQGKQQRKLSSSRLRRFFADAIGLWSFADILVDAVTRRKQAMVEVTCYSMADVCILQPAAFSVMKDALIS